MIAGLEKKNRVLNKMEKERVADHETGHALVALSIPGSDQVQKISRARLLLEREVITGPELKAILNEDRARNHVA